MGFPRDLLNKIIRRTKCDFTYQGNMSCVTVKPEAARITLLWIPKPQEYELRIGKALRALIGVGLWLDHRREKNGPWLTTFSASGHTFFQVNRAEHQKLNLEFLVFNSAFGRSR